MELRTWIEDERGRLKALAEHFEITPSAVSQWLNNGVPVDRIAAVRDFTAGVVTLEDMLPKAAPSQERAAA
jgi:DNA-binding transcriptional regulator YdaS (Cro superfamily)